MKTQVFIAIVLISVVDVLSRSVEHANLHLLSPRDKCGFQVGSFPAPPSDGSGAPAGLAEFPWLALLEYSKSTGTGLLRHSCSGTLISERYVVTAAHCVSGIAEKQIGDVTRVRLGEHNVKTEQDCVDKNGESICADADVVKDIEVETITVHPEYDEKNISHYNDIAVIRLKSAAPYTDYIRPICLPLGDEQSAAGHFFLSGWDRDNKDESNNLKQKASLPFISASECQSRYTNFKVKLSSGQLCAGGIEGIHSCIALGGSPLMAPLSDNKQIYMEGIVSFGPSRCATAGVPDVFTKVAEYVPWILENMKP